MFSLAPNTNYFFELGDVSLNTSNISDLISSSSFVFQSAGDGQFNGSITTARLPVLVPDRTITVEGVAKLKDFWYLAFDDDAENWAGNGGGDASNGLFYNSREYPITQTGFTGDVDDNYLWLTPLTDC